MYSRNLLRGHVVKAEAKSQREEEAEKADKEEFGCTITYSYTRKGLTEAT